MQYIDYEFDDFILDDSFINFATNKNQLDVIKWEKWFSHDPENKEIALEAKILISHLRFKKQEISTDIVNDNWFKLKDRLNLNKIILPTNKNNIFKRKLWQYAVAGSLILFFVSTIYYLSIIPECENVDDYHEIIVAKGEIKKIFLPDSTLVFINADSKLKYSNCFGKKQREVFLVGEASFDVKYDAKKPFIVHTQENDITVLGTVFNVFAYSNENIFRASLERGKISVSHNDDETIELEVNQTYLLTIDNNKTEILESENVQSYSSWKDGKIVVRNLQFNDIMRKLERSHNVIFDLQNEKIENCRFTGTFTTDDDINTILQVIKLTTLFDYEIVKDTVIIK